MTIRRNPLVPSARTGSRPGPSRRRRGLRTAPGLALAVLLVGCASSAALERSQQYLEDGFTLQAYLEVDAERTRLQEAGLTVGSELEAAWLDLRYRYLIDLSREAIYANREQRGLELAGQALAMRPGDAAAAELIARAKRKMAVRATAAGQTALAKGDFEDAMLAFQEALVHLPGYGPAEEGVAAVREAVSRLHREAQEQFLEAIRKMPQFRYSEVDWHATAALSRDPSREDAGEVQDRALKELAIEAQRRAEASKAEKGYGAALMEYRTARELWSGLPGVDDYIRQMEREVAAMQKIEAAQLAIQADRLEDARHQLDAAYELSQLERTTIDELRFEARRRAGTIRYEAARDLELQGDKAGALAAFEALSAEWPDGLEDERTRIGALRSDIAGAEKAYTAGVAAQERGDLADALDQFRTARTYYEGFKDVAQRIEQLQAELERAGGDGS
ncbi:MAG: hypothetical protein AB7O97_17445 [Planctomycetota bacterium]